MKSVWTSAQTPSARTDAPIHVLEGAVDQSTPAARKTSAQAQCQTAASAVPEAHAGRRYERRSPAMALGLTDHVWSWDEFLRLPVSNG